ncbi:hypothetical protein EBZ80_07125 [bacterium]|nr:hypothetical protein [bacterium]
MLTSRDAIPFLYSVNISLLANGTGSSTLVLGIDSDFELYGFEARTSQDIDLANPRTAATSQPDLFTIFITDTSTGRALMTQPAFRSQICSNSTQNFTPEGVRIRFPRQEQFQFDFVNLTAAALDIQFSLRGYKIFNPAVA